MSHHATTRAWDSGARGNDMLTLLALADFAGGHKDPYDYAYPAIPTLAGKTGLSTRTVQRCLRSLEAASVIERTGQHVWGAGRATIQYRLTGVTMTGCQSDTPVKSDDEKTTHSHPTPSSNPALESSSTSPATKLDLDESVPQEMRHDAAELLASMTKVGTRRVTPREMGIAAAALAEFNRQAGSAYALGRQLAPIVGRIRECPSMPAEQHVRLVQAAWRRRWWEKNGNGGRPAPNVIYGNPAVFEQVVQDAIDEKNGTKRGIVVPISRYSRED